MTSAQNEDRRHLLKALVGAPFMAVLMGTRGANAQIAAGTLQPAPETPLASWNDGAAKQAILDFVRVTTDASNANFVKPQAWMATFDQDGTLWVEQPMYSQVIYCLDRVPAVVKARPELAKVEPFKTVLTGDMEAIAKLPMPQLEKVLAATLTGMSVDEFTAEATKWLGSAKDRRWQRLYTELTCQPMQEVMKYLRANGYKTDIVTGGGQDYVRVYSEATYGVPPEQVVGTAGGTKYGYAQGLPTTKVGAFAQTLYDEAKKSGWVVISMKEDWKRVFSFDT